MPSAMIRRSVISKVGYMNTDLKFLIDWDYWLKITLFYNVYYIDKKTISYRWHNTNLTKVMSDDAFLEEFKYSKDSLLTLFPNDVMLKRNIISDLLFESRYYANHNYLKLIKFILNKTKKKIFNR